MYRRLGGESALGQVEGMGIRMNDQFLLANSLKGVADPLGTDTAIASTKENSTIIVCHKVDGQECLYCVSVVFETIELVNIVSINKTNRTKARVQPNKWIYDKENSILTLDEDVDSQKYVVMIQGEKAVPWILKHIKAKAETIKMVVNDRIGIIGDDFFYDLEEQAIVFSKELSDESTRFCFTWQNVDCSEDCSYVAGNTQITDKMRELLES